MKGNVIVWGPPGSGKTTNAAALAARYGISIVKDNPADGEEIPSSGVLILQQQEPKSLPKHWVAFHIDDVLMLLRMSQPLIFSHELYEALVQQTISQLHELSRVKGGEYAGDQDRLANFRRNAAALGLSMEQVWAIYAAKHWDSLMQFVKDLGQGTTRPRSEPLAGRADDLIVYLILFKAMLQERGQA